MRILDASQVRRSFAQVVESVGETRDVVVVVRYGRPIAAIVPVTRLTRTERDALAAPKMPTKSASRGKVSTVGRSRRATR